MAKDKGIRIEELLVERGIAPTVEKARALIMTGEVMIGSERVKSGAQLVDRNVELATPEEIKFVSRGGLKLDHALSEFKISVEGKVCADVGAATGGFSDVLLQRNAAKIYAVDVGYGDLHWKVRSDERVVPIERTNARYLEALPEPVSLIAVDVSFISVTLLLHNFYKWLGDQGDLVVLLKPQFEATQEEVSAGEGIITDEAIHRRVIQGAIKQGESEGFKFNQSIQSPITGTHGNIEYLIWFSKGSL